MKRDLRIIGVLFFLQVFCGCQKKTITVASGFMGVHLVSRCLQSYPVGEMKPGNYEIEPDDHVDMIDCRTPTCSHPGIVTLGHANFGYTANFSYGWNCDNGGATAVHNYLWRWGGTQISDLTSYICGDKTIATRAVEESLLEELILSADTANAQTAMIRFRKKMLESPDIYGANKHIRISLEELSFRKLHD